MKTYAFQADTKTIFPNNITKEEKFCCFKYAIVIGVGFCNAQRPCYGLEKKHILKMQKNEEKQKSRKYACHMCGV